MHRTLSLFFISHNGYYTGITHTYHTATTGSLLYYPSFTQHVCQTQSAKEEQERLSDDDDDRKNRAPFNNAQ